MITPEPWKFYDQFESSDRNLTHTACSTFHIYKSSYLWKFLGSLCDLLTFNSLLDIFLLNRDFENCVEQKVIPPRNCRQNLISLKRHFLTFSIIVRIIYALMCQTRYIRYHKIHFTTIKQDLYHVWCPKRDSYLLFLLCHKIGNKILWNRYPDTFNYCRDSLCESVVKGVT